MTLSKISGGVSALAEQFEYGIQPALNLKSTADIQHIADLLSIGITLNIIQAFRGGYKFPFRGR